MSKDILYFAYGSNLDTARLETRLKHIPESKPARLPDYRLIFDKKAKNGEGTYANIVRAPGSEVWGVVYFFDSTDLALLDKCEGVSGGHYEHEHLEVEIENGVLVQAISYKACSKWIALECRPTMEYLRHVIEGARNHGLSETYIDQVTKIATAGIDGSLIEHTGDTLL